MSAVTFSARYDTQSSESSSCSLLVKVSSNFQDDNSHAHNDNYDVTKMTITRQVPNKKLKVSDVTNFHVHVSPLTLPLFGVQ